MRRKPARRVLELITTVPWAITAEALQTIIAIAGREGLDPETIATKVYGRIPEPEALAAKPGDLLEGTSAVTVREGVATIPLIGPMFRYADFFTQMSGGTTYDTLAIDFAIALESPDVGAILLDVDSPGGEANGVGELAQLFYSARAIKPVIAYIGGMGASAAYWLAAAAREVVVNETAIVGSIGVRMELLETWMRDASKGLRTIPLVSAQSPKKLLAATDLQVIIDELASQFINAVAQYRAVSAETVAQDFGQGGVFVGQAAIDAGLADRLGTYEAIHAELAAEAGRSGELPLDLRRFTALPPAPGAAALQLEASMNPPNDKKNDAPAAGTPATPTAEQVEAQYPKQVAQMKTAAHAEGLAAGHAVGLAEGAEAERKRILAIEDLAVSGHEQLIVDAKRDPAATPEATAMKLIKAQRENPAAPAATPDPGKKHLANLAGDEAQANAPSAQLPKGEAAVAETVQGLVQLSTLRRAQNAAAN